MRLLVLSALLMICVLPGWTDAATGAETGKEQPNFVFILSDDQDWTGLSVQVHPDEPNSKSDFHQTPNLEVLASQGLCFSSAYSPAPVCSPTRISLQTGMSPAQLQWTKASPVMTEADGYKMIPPTHRKRISSDETTIAEMLGTVGYATAHYGKWHIGGGGPESHGYDEGDGDTSNGDAAPFVDPNPVDLFGSSERAAAFMEKNTKAGKPFYIQLSHHALHYSENSLKSTQEKYSQLPPGRMHKDIPRAAMTENLDTAVGMIMQTIEELGIGENTYLVYMSDNGGGGKGTARPVTGGKGSVLEGGIRIPLIIRGPGVKANAYCDVPVVGYDLFTTFCELAGVSERLPDGVEGGNIAGLFATGAGTVTRPREELVFHFPHYQSGHGPHSAIRLGDHKLVKFYETGESKLFDLSKDLREQNDLARDMPEKAADLGARLEQYLKTVNAQMAMPNPSYDPNVPPTDRRGRKQARATTGGGQRGGQGAGGQGGGRNRTGGGGQGGGGGGLRSDPIMIALDADGDGVLSTAEIANVTSVLEKFDTNGDGRVSREELAAPER